MKTLLKFEADWCGPCQQIKPIVSDVLDKHQAVTLKSVNIDKSENEALVAQHSVRAIPTLVLLDESDAVIDVHRGSLSRPQLETFLNQ